MLTKLFKPFGEIVEINIPRNDANNRPKGFAFVQMKNIINAKNAIRKLNDSKYKGRKITVTESVDKRIFLFNQKNKPKVEKVEEKKEEETAMEIEEPEKKTEEEEEKEKKPKEKYQKPKTKEELKTERRATVFVRNIGYETTYQQLWEHFRKFGWIDYLKLCAHHQEGQHKGTAFMKFKKTSSAKKLVKLSE